jgi:hypothetical protein
MMRTVKWSHTNDFGDRTDPVPMVRSEVGFLAAKKLQSPVWDTTVAMRPVTWTALIRYS